MSTNDHWKSATILARCALPRGGTCHQFGCRQTCRSPKLCGGNHGPVYCHLINTRAIRPGATDEISDYDTRKTHVAKLATTGCTMATTSFRMCQSAYSPTAPPCGQECTAMRLTEEANNTDVYTPCRTECAYGEGHMSQCLCNCTMPSEAHRDSLINNGPSFCDNSTAVYTPPFLHATLSDQRSEAPLLPE